MGLRSQLLSSPELLSDFVWCAEQRFLEGEDLLANGRFTGAVYLLGLAGEMWLKLAAFRLRVGNPSTPVQPFLAPIRNWMRIRAPLIDAEAYHSLRFWAEAVIRLRSENGRKLSKELIGGLRHHVMHRLFQDWKIDIRYRQLIIPERQAWRVHQDVTWIRDHSRILWR